MFYILLLYNNLITGNIFINIHDFVELNKNNLIDIVDQVSYKSYTNLNNTNKKYEYETEIFKYIGYILLNSVDDNYEEQINKFFENDNKLVCLDESYIHISYRNLIEYSKKECLIYKIKIIEYLGIYNKLTKELMDKIYIKLLKKYYNIDTKKNYLNTILLKSII